MNANNRNSIFGSRENFEDLCINNPAQAIAMAIASRNREIIDDILGRDYVLIYLQKTLPVDDAIALAKNIRHWKVWQIILDRSDITPEEKIEYAKEMGPIDGNMNVWHMLFKNKAVKKHLQSA